MHKSGVKGANRNDLMAFHPAVHSFIHSKLMSRLGGRLRVLTVQKPPRDEVIVSRIGADRKNRLLVASRLGSSEIPANELWQADTLYGPPVQINGVLVPTRR